MEGPPKQETRLSELNDLIGGMRAGIEREYAKGGNSWAACVGSRVFQLETVLHGTWSGDTSVPEDKLALAKERIEAFKYKLADLKRDYPERDSVPPQDVQEEIIRELNVLR